MDIKNCLLSVPEILGVPGEYVFTQWGWTPEIIPEWDSSKEGFNYRELTQGILTPPQPGHGYPEYEGYSEDPWGIPRVGIGCGYMYIPFTIITTQPMGLIVNYFGSFTLSISYTFDVDNPPIIQWKKNGIDIPGATTQSYTKSNALTSDSGLYSVVLTNVWGKTESEPAEIKVKTQYQANCLTTQQIIDRIYSKLTGGRRAELEIDPQAIKDAINDAFARAREWYYEPRFAQTVNVVNSGEARYIVRSSINKPIREIHKIFSTEVASSLLPGKFDANLMGIDRGIKYSEGYVEEAYWIEFSKSIENMGMEEIDWYLLPDKVLLSGNVPPRVTVSYYPQPMSIEDVCSQKALDWMIDWATATVAKSVGRVRGKFTGGDLNIETDSSDLVSDAQTQLERLQEALPNLDFRLH